MGRLTDRGEIRRRLEVDRWWSVYALGDLAPGYWDAAEWYGPEGSDAVVLIYRAAEPPILLSSGDPEQLAAALDTVPDEPVVMLSVRTEALELIRRRWEVPSPTLMWRMALVEQPVERATPDVAERLTSESLSAVRELFSDGDPTGEAPDYFLPQMLRDGVYYGVWEGDRLLAAAGTHLVAASENVATVGNVYTRRDCRGRGMGRLVTAAVVRELRGRDLGTIALNVRQSNAAAIAVYESLGFRRYCSFYEVMARLRKRV